MVDLNTMSRPSSSQSFHPQHHPHHQRQEPTNATQHQMRTGGYCLRSNLRRRLFKTGRVIQKHAGVVLFVGVLLLLTLSVSLKSATIETDIESLWVEEDGRVEKELNYIRKTLGEGIGSTNQLLIQTPRDPQANILHPESLLHHLEVMKAATEVTVDLFEVTWRLKDVCLTPSIPSFEEVHVEKIFDHLFPCAIMSPLDCFWEGSKLLGPDYPVRIPGLPHLNVKWTNLHPESLFSMLKGMESLSSFPFESFHEIMKRAGITSAYQEKPCLNPEDADCPATAPNKGNGMVPDVASELTGGCYGFATKYMHWPEDLIVGGAKKNRTGHIVRANAIQTVIQLMGEQEMHEFWAKDYKVHNVDWTIEKARMVLEAWQRKFSAEVSKLVAIDGRKPPVIPRSRQYSYTLFTTTLLSDIMRNFSRVNHMKIGIGFLVILLFVALTSWSREDSNSFVFVSTTGVCLIGLSIVSSLGLCSLFRLPLNAATTQITPFLALGFGVCLLQLLIYSYAAVYQRRSHLYFDDLVGEVLQKVGPVIAVISLCGVTGFLSAFFIPIPALRAFVLQFAIILALVTGALLIIFPAILSLDLRRRRTHRVDLFCCLHRSVTDEEMNGAATSSTNHRQASSSNHHRYSSSPRQPRRHLPNNLLSSSVRHTHNDLNSLKPISSGECPVHSSKTGEAFHPFKKLECTCFTVRVPVTDSEADTDTDNEETSIQQTRRLSTSRNGHDYQVAVVGEKGEDESRTPSFLLSSLIKCHSQLLKKKAFKWLVLMGNTIILLISLSGLPNVRDGLELTDIVPRGTVEHKYLEVQHKFFSFYNMFVVTEGNFEYPTNQKLLYEYHQSFNRISKIIKNDDGGLPEFWLSTFRDWLRNLQDAYDRDSSMGFISQEGWRENASSDAILAYKLLVQTGRNDYPVDKSLVIKVRLVDKEGIINPKAFYTYLTAWASNDALAYYASQANLKPEPREWFHDPSDTELKIPKSQPLTYTQIPFYLNRMNSTEEIVTTIREVRAICQKFEEERGLPNFPSGVPFVFWEQYVRLPFYAATSGLIALAIVFGLVGIFLFNIWASSLVVFFLILIAVQLYGLMGFFGINFSAVPAVILVISVGLGTVFFLPVVFTFLTCQGGRRYRTFKSVKETGVPVLHGSLGLLVGVFMLYWSEFDFIINYFFLVLLGFIILGMFYAFLLLPILLSMMGPPPEPSISIEESLLHTPSEESGSPKTSSRKEGARRIKTLPNQFSRRDPKVQSDISLSTIPEESHSQSPNSGHHPYYQSSREIVVQPEFVVETTTFTSPVPMSSCKVGNGGDEGSSSISPQTSFTPNCESPLSREVTASPTSDAGSSSGASSMSRPNSAPAECVHTSSRSHSASIPSTAAHCSHHQIPQTVTTKVTTTAKLKVELHAPPHYVRTTGGDGNSNSSSSSSSSNVGNSKDSFHKGYRDKYYFLNKDNHRSSNNNSR